MKIRLVTFVLAAVVWSQIGNAETKQRPVEGLVGYAQTINIVEVKSVNIVNEEDGPRLLLEIVVAANIMDCYDEWHGADILRTRIKSGPATWNYGLVSVPQKDFQNCPGVGNRIFKIRHYPGYATGLKQSVVLEGYKYTKENRNDNGNKMYNGENNFVINYTMDEDYRQITSISFGAAGTALD